MKPDDFERQLQRQPLRPVPNQWREEILHRARQSANSSTSEQTGVGQAAPAVREIPWWREWFWPCPEAWAGMAALWLVILGLNATAPSSGDLAVDQTSTSRTDTAPSLAEQRRELARLLDGAGDWPPTRKPATAPGPRSEGTSPSKV